MPEWFNYWYRCLRGDHNTAHQTLAGVTSGSSFWTWDQIELWSWLAHNSCRTPPLSFIYYCDFDDFRTRSLHVAWNLLSWPSWLQTCFSSVASASSFWDDDAWPPSSFSPWLTSCYSSCFTMYCHKASDHRAASVRRRAMESPQIQHSPDQLCIP